MKYARRLVLTMAVLAVSIDSTVSTRAQTPLFHRGDADSDGKVDLTDGVRILEFLFLGGAPPTCLDAADTDGNNQLQLTDGVLILAYLFLGDAPPVAPGPPSGHGTPSEGCGPDNDDVHLGCASYQPCGSLGGVGTYLRSLPPWSTFAPRGPDTDPAPTGELPVVTEETVTVRNINDDGTVTVTPDVDFVCESTPYSFRSNPEQYVMYGGQSGTFWAGALIDGKDWRDSRGGAGSLRGLSIPERSPGDVLIPSLHSAVPVEAVNQANVETAIRQMILDATIGDIEPGKVMYFGVETYHSEEQFALSMKASGRFLNFKASMRGDLRRNASETTVAVHFLEQMFEVVVPPPSTPEGFFSKEFTEEKLAEQIALGKCRPENPPLYISKVVYGRMMTFALTSTATEEEIKATLRASANWLVGRARLNLTLKQRKILEESRVAIASYGGPAEATEAMIRALANVDEEGDNSWTAYFDHSAPLSTALPLSYTVTTLDGTFAGVTEAPRYYVTKCRPAGQFLFLPAQSFSPPVTPPFQDVVTGDVNHDDRGDLIWNHRYAADNEVAVGMGNADGSIGRPLASRHPEGAPGGWGNYTLQTGDFNGDRQTDLIWYSLGEPNRFYVATGNSDGSFKFHPPQEYPALGHGTLKFSAALLIGDINGDGKSDLIRNTIVAENLSSSYWNYVHAGLSRGDGSFDFSSPEQVDRRTWGGYRAFVADLNGDGRDDLLWNSLGTSNVTHYAMSLGDGVFQFDRGGQGHPVSTDWSKYVARIGDFDGDGRPDLLWNYTRQNGNFVYFGRGVGNGTFSFTAPSQNLFPSTGPGPFTTLIGDVDSDGHCDVIWSSLAGDNRVAVGRGTVTGALDVSALAQTHPVAASWENAKTLIADVNGDEKDDIVWIIPGAPTRVFVGLARRPQ